jgi:mannose-1-phosphate guanylyltransferase
MMWQGYEAGAGERDGLWAIVLAGGEGTRLLPLVRRLYEEDRPKQYAVLTGSRSMLRHTLDRTALAIPPQRTVVVTNASHAKYLAQEFGGRCAQQLLIQPENRGTAVAVFLPARCIQAFAPDATVAVFPSDHFVLEERDFMAHVRAAADAVERYPQWIVLLGAKATEPEREYGWIEPGEVVCATSYARVLRVRGFLEKPSYALACESLARGFLWNTLVLVAKLETLLRAQHQFAPFLDRQLDRLTRWANRPQEQWALQDAYASMPRLNFSRLILSQCPFLAVLEMSGISWSDWGTPRRVLASLEKVQLIPDRLERNSRSLPA